MRKARRASDLSLYKVSLRNTASVKALKLLSQPQPVINIDGDLQANRAAYIGPERKNQRRKPDSLSLNQSAVHMKARKLVTMDMMKT